MKTRNKISSVLFVGILLARASACGQGSLHVFGPPESQGNLNGNSSFAPFATAASGRFQQVYSASSLSPLIQPGGVYLSAIAFRVDATVGFSFDTTIQNFQLNLSTTPRSPDGLSTTFSENIGPDDMMVMGPSSMRLRGLGGGGTTGFDIFFDFRDNPFYYNPANGNLLLDFRIFTGAGNPPPFGNGGSPLDAFNIAGDSVSSVSAYDFPSLPSTRSASSLGLATEFFTQPVPEPSSWALLVLGVICVGLWRKTKLHERGNDVPH